MPDKKDFISKAIKRPGALRKAMGVKKGEKIPKDKIDAKQKALQEEAKGDKKLSPAKRRLLRQLTLAKTLDKIRNKNK